MDKSHRDNDFLKSHQQEDAVHTYEIQTQRNQSTMIGVRIVRISVLTGRGMRESCRVITWFYTYAITCQAVPLRVVYLIACKLYLN